MSDEARVGTEVLDEWVAQIEEKISRPICREMGVGNPTPYLAFARDSYDGNLRFVIDGHKIKAQHVWVDGTDMAEPIVLDSIVEGETVFVGYKSDMGMSFMIHPDSLCYMDESEQERPHPMELFLSHLCEEFFDGWREGQMDIRIMSIFNRMRGNNMERLRQEVQRHRQLLMDLYARSDQHLGDLAIAQRKVIAAENMDPSEFRQECAGWEETLLQQGSLNIDNENNLCLRMPVFTINDGSDWNDGNGVDVELGPITVRFNLGDYSMKVSSEDHISHGDRYVHPHVGADGRICWGESTRLIEGLLENPNPMEILFTTAHFLQTGYHEPGAYQSLKNWLPPTGWMCERCRVRHQDGARCPQQCAHCEEYVDFSQHAHCDEHGHCYTRPGMCQGCMENLPRISDSPPGTEEMPNTIRPAHYINPENEQERAATLEFIGFGRELLLDANLSFIKDGEWFWIQSNSDDDGLLVRMDYIYKRQENGSYTLHWSNPSPAEVSENPEVAVAEESEDDEETTGSESPIETSQEAMLRYYYTGDMTAQNLVDHLHTDRIPSYDDVPEAHRAAMRAFRRRGTAQRLRLCERFISNQQGLDSTGS